MTYDIGATLSNDCTINRMKNDKTIEDINICTSIDLLTDIIPINYAWRPIGIRGDKVWHPTGRRGDKVWHPIGWQDVWLPIRRRGLTSYWETRCGVLLGDEVKRPIGRRGVTSNWETRWQCVTSYCDTRCNVLLGDDVWSPIEWRCVTPNWVTRCVTSY